MRVLDDEDMIPLLNAVKGNHAAVATHLVQHGANPNDKAHNLLMDAIVVSNTELASLLVEKGANIKYADEDGMTVLTQADYLGEVPIVKVLLAAGADVTAANNEGITALIAACSEGHVSVVELLLENEGVNAIARDKDGTSAVIAAAGPGHKALSLF